MNPSHATLIKRLALPGVFLLTSASLGIVEQKDLSKTTNSSISFTDRDSSIKIFSSVGVVTGISAMLIVFSVWNIERKS